MQMIKILEKGEHTKRREDPFSYWVTHSLYQLLQEQIKQQNNDHKPWVKVLKVCPDPKGVIFTHL